ELVLDELSPEVRAALNAAEKDGRIDVHSEQHLKQMQEIAEASRIRADAARPRVKATLEERNTPALFGAGLIDSIPVKVLERMTSRHGVDAKIRGRLPKLKDGRVGR